MTIAEKRKNLRQQLFELQMQKALLNRRELPDSINAQITKTLQEIAHLSREKILQEQEQEEKVR